MPTQITTAAHQDSLSGSSEKRLDIAPDGTLWLCVADVNRARFFSSTNGGANWSAASSSDLTYGSGQDTGTPSFFIDADGYAHCTFVRWQQNPQTLLYARGTPRSGGGWSWKTLVVAPAGGRMNVDSDVIAFRNGTGWVAWVTWSYGSSGGSRVSRIDISAAGTLSLNSLVHGPASGDASWQFGALAFAGDSKVPQTNPHVFLVSASQATSSPLYAHRAQYSSGTWSWGTPISVATGITIPETVMACAHDGTRLIVAWSPNNAVVNVSQWDGVAGAATAINPPALAQGNLRGVSLSIDPATADIYLVAHDATDGDVFWTKYTRATTSWLAWASLVSRSPNGQDGDVQLVRNPTRDAVDLVYATGSSPNNVLWYTKVAGLSRTPSAPTLVSPAPGAKLNLAAGATFTWTHSKVSPGDSQSQWQFRRNDGSITEYWNDSTKAWTTGGTDITDAFTTENTAYWNGYGGPYSFVTAGQLQITCRSAYDSIATTAASSLVGSSVAVEVPLTPNLGSGTTEAILSFDADASNRLGILYSGGNIAFREVVGGVTSDTSATYNSTNDRWWRIRESGGTVYWETSANGTSWTTRRSKSTTVPLTSGTILLICGYYGTESSPGVARFDNYTFSNSSTSTVWNTSASTNPEQVVFGSGKWTNGTSYSWSVRTKAADGSTSPFAADRTVIATASPVVVVTAPSGIVYGSTTPTVSWTYTATKAQRDFEVRILDPSAGAIDASNPTPSVWGSGVVASAVARSIVVASSLPNSSGTYRAYVRCTDIDGVASAWSYSTFSLSTVPALGPSLSCEPYSPYSTGVPRVQLGLSGRVNYMADAQASGVTGWDAVSNAALTVQGEDALNGRMAGFLITTTGAGTAKVRTSAGSPPEAPFGRAALTGPLDFPVVAGADYTAVASLRRPTAAANRSSRISIEWYDKDDGSGALLSTSVGVQGVITETGYTQVVVQAQAPVGAVLARVVIEMLSAAAAGEVIYVARASFAPGRSLEWRSGGNAQRQTVRIERSDDGGSSWTEIVSGQRTDYWQRLTYDDRLCPFGIEVQYRGWTDITDAAGRVSISDTSAVAATTVESSSWALRDPDEDTVEVVFHVTAYSRSEDDGAVVTYPAGATYPIVDSEDARIGGGSVKAFVQQQFASETARVLRRAVPLVLSSPIGEVMWIRVLGRGFDAVSPANREYTVDFAVVAQGSS